MEKILVTLLCLFSHLSFSQDLARTETTFFKVNDRRKISNDFFYADNGKTVVQSVWNKFSGNWDKNYKTIYNSDRKVTTKYERLNQKWRLSSKVVITGVEEGMLTEVFENNLKGLGQIAKSVMIKLDDSDSSYSFTNSRFDFTKSEWLNSYKYAHNSLGENKGKFVVTYKWNKKSSIWEPSKKTIYPPCGNRREIKFYHYDKNDWKLVRIVDKIEQVPNRRVSLAYTINSNGERMESKRTLEEINANGSIKRKSFFSWDDSRSNWILVKRTDFFYFNSKQHAEEVESSNDARIFIYPNPASDLLNIELIKGVGNLEIRDAAGKVVVSKENVELGDIIKLNIGKWNAGSYFVFQQGKYAGRFNKM